MKSICISQSVDVNIKYSVYVIIHRLTQDFRVYTQTARRAQRDDAQSESECPTDSETESENIRSIAELPREEDSLQDNVEGRKDYQEVDDVQMTDVDSSPVKSLTYSWIDEEAQLPGSVDPDLADTGAQAVVFPVIKSEEQDGELSKATVRPATADLQSLGMYSTSKIGVDILLFCVFLHLVAQSLIRDRSPGCRVGGSTTGFKR
jgi:hypothetical protein